MSKSKNTICLGVDEIIKRQTMPLYEYPELMRKETPMEEASETLLELLKSYKKTAFDQLLGVYREPRIKHDFCYEKSHYGLAKLGQEKHLCRQIFFKNGFPLDLAKNLGRPIQYELNVTRSLNMRKSNINVDLVSYQEEKKLFI